MNFEKLVCFVGALLLFAVLTCTESLSAQLLNTPVYDPGSKSYFELVDGRNMIKGYGSSEGPNWEEALKLARARAYKGVNGRLAVVQSIETHFFLERTFQPEWQSWIGLRLWCTRHVLQWSDGQVWKPGAFQAWDSQWSHDTYTCNSAGQSPTGMKVYAPISYTPISEGFRWVAMGIQKRFYSFFVQYPTGHP